MHFQVVGVRYILDMQYRVERTTNLKTAVYLWLHVDIHVADCNLGSHLIFVCMSISVWSHPSMFENSLGLGEPVHSDRHYRGVDYYFVTC